MFIRTQRLFLRPLFAEDWRQVYREIADAKVVRMLARAPWPYQASDARMFCANSEKTPGLRFAITGPDLSGAPLIGVIGLEPLNDTSHELGYWLGRRWHGRGHATEAVNGVLEIAKAIGIERVDARHFLDNPASGAVLRKCGFVPTGEVVPVASAGRGGNLVLSRRYMREFDAQELAPMGAAA